MNTIKCLITGAGKGLGYEMALALNQVENIEMYAISRSHEDLKKLNDQALVTQNKKINTWSDDINNISKIEWEAYLNHIGGIDILILNAAELVVKPTLETTPEEFQRIFKTNFFTPLNFIKWSVPLFNMGVKQILFIGTMGLLPNVKPLPNISAYLMSKSAFHCLCEMLATELEPLNFHCNLIALGGTDTPMLNKVVPEYEHKQSPQKAADFIKDYILGDGMKDNGHIKIVSQI